MHNALISNPPYNMKWSHPPFAQLQPRFCDCNVPPESNANYAFILTAISKSYKSAMIMPCNVLSTENVAEKEIRKYLVDKNLIEAVILCPDKMFESTSISTCILVLRHEKATANIMFLDMRQTYVTEQREQNGQFGGSAHEGRTYKKEVKTFSEEQIHDAIDAINKMTDIKGYSKSVSCQTVSENNYSLVPSGYIELEELDNHHRRFEDIIDDLNRTIDNKNILKLTINETVAKSLGLYEFGESQRMSAENSKKMSHNMEKLFGKRILRDNYISLTKRKGEIKFENTSDSRMSPIFKVIMQMYKANIVYLNEEENRLLVELRDAILPELMSGKIDINVLEDTN